MLQFLKTAILYQKQINDIIPYQPISVEIFALNLLRIGTSGADPDLQMALVDAGGNDISSIAKLHLSLFANRNSHIPKNQNYLLLNKE